MVTYIFQVNNVSNISNKIAQLNDRIPANLSINATLNNITFNSSTNEITFDFAQNLSTDQLVLLNVLIKVNVEERPLLEFFPDPKIVTTTKIPSNINDNLNGYPIGSISVNTDTQTVYFCYDNTTSNAIWNSQSNKSLSFNYSFNNGFETTNNTYIVAGYLIYPGTLTAGNITSILALMYSIQSGNTYQVRVVDTTNNNTIAESNVTSGCDMVTPKIIDLNIVSNLPTTRAVFEIQIRKDSGGNRIGIHSIQMF